MVLALASLLGAVARVPVSVEEVTVVDVTLPRLLLLLTEFVRTSTASLLPCLSEPG